MAKLTENKQPLMESAIRDKMKELIVLRDSSHSRIAKANNALVSHGAVPLFDWAGIADDVRTLAKLLDEYNALIETYKNTNFGIKEPDPFEIDF